MKYETMTREQFEARYPEFAKAQAAKIDGTGPQDKVTVKLDNAGYYRSARAQDVKPFVQPKASDLTEAQRDLLLKLTPSRVREFRARGGNEWNLTRGSEGQTLRKLVSFGLAREGYHTDGEEFLTPAGIEVAVALGHVAKSEEYFAALANSRTLDELASVAGEARGKSSELRRALTGINDWEFRSDPDAAAAKQAARKARLETLMTPEEADLFAEAEKAAERACLVTETLLGMVDARVQALREVAYALDRKDGAA